MCRFGLRRRCRICLVGEAMADSAEGAAFVPVARVPQLVVLN